MNIVVFCGSSMGRDSAYYQAARAMGTWIAGRGDKLVYGGSCTGLMDVVSGTVLAAGGEVIGVETGFFVDRGVANSRLTRLVVVDSMAERKQRMIELGDAFVALPGGIGTLDEVTEVACDARIGLPEAAGKPLVLFDVNGYWQPMRDMMAMAGREGFLPERGADGAAGYGEDLIQFARDFDELERILSRRKAG